MLPTVSVIIPCRNEEKFICDCLQSIIESDFPREGLEVIVVDGMSEDRTRVKLAEIIQNYSFIKLLDNPNKIVSSALNIGIQAAKGRIIMRMDAHAQYNKNYISKCVEYLQKSGADNVGGICITLSGAATLIAESIAIALSHPFGVGNSYFRIGVKEPRYVDTVPFGCYKKEIFERIGFFDEGLVRNQDDEFNMRLINSGGKILLTPDIVSYYYARESLLKLAKMYFQYGYFKPLVGRKLKKIVTLRQVIPAIFIAILLISSILSIFLSPFFIVVSGLFFIYLSVNLGFCLLISYKKGIKYFLVLPLAFGLIHFSYGFGYLKGIWDFVLLRKKMDKHTSVPLTR